MTRPPLFVELCCGSAAVTLRLIGGSHARPPVSYMGSKNGYATAILNVLGLRSGQGAEAVLLCDAGPWAKVWQVLVDPQGCRDVAAVIRGWIGEDARALWDRLWAEPVADGWGSRDVAAWFWINAHSLGNIPATHNGERWVGVGGGLHFDSPESRKARGCWGGTLGGKGCLERIEAAAPWPPSSIVHGDAAAVSPRDVAAWIWKAGNSYRRGDPSSGFDDAAARVASGAKWGADTTAAALRSLDTPPVWPPTAIAHADAQQVPVPERLPPGSVVYIDPPYQGTTGYADDLPRAQVLALAQRWAEAGALVCVSEAEPLALEGWHHVEITDCRVGQKRTFSKQKREWLTLSQPPAWVPERQADMFATKETE